MKRIGIGILLTLALLALIVCASAAPLLTDGDTVAWIGNNNYLFLRNSEMQVRQLMIPVKDLLSFTDTDVYCLMEDNRVYSVKRDGTGSAQVYRQATEAQIEGLRDQRYTLKEGTLTVSGMTLSDAAIAAATDHRYLYYIIKRGNSYRLIQYMLPEELDNLDATPVANLNGLIVPEPVAMTVSPEYLVVTAQDHSLMTISLAGGETTLFPATSYSTASAALVGGTLYRYQSDGYDRWSLEKTESMPDMTGTKETTVPLVTLAPTATPTPTPTPTATPRVTATPTPESITDEDGNIQKGASGSDIRAIQKRLDALGYPVGVIDGSYGDDTQTAVNLFYAAIGEKERNYITQDMQDRLFSKSAPTYDPYLTLVKGDSGTMVLRMQQRLAALGFEVGKQDGKYGDKTVEAVALFQDIIGLKLSKYETQGEKASHDLLECLYSQKAPTYRAWKEGRIPLPEPSDLRGWIQQGENWNYYSSEGYRLKDWQQIDGNWFYFSEAGIMRTGWQEINRKWYYFSEKTDEKGNVKGAMVKGWFEDKEAEKKSKGKKIWYWLDENGAMVTGWVEIDGQWEYFSDKGVWQGSQQ